MEWLFQAFIDNPAIPIFLSVGAGFWFGRFQIKGIGLGSVTATLLAGVVIGAVVKVTDSSGTVATIVVANETKQIFFLLFLFALGYRVGPQFFQGLRGNGRPQALFTLVLIAVGITSAIVLSKLLGYNPGLAAGLTAGALTQSSIIGVAQDAITGLGQDSTTTAEWQNLVSVGYAVTYIFGTIGAAIYCAGIAPRLLGIKDLPGQAKEEEKRLGFDEPVTDTRSAFQQVMRRTFVVPPGSKNKPSDKLEADLHAALGARLSVDRVRTGDGIVEMNVDPLINGGDTIVLATTDVAAFAYLEEHGFGEVEDEELLDFPIEELDIIITNDEVADATISDLKRLGKSHRLFVKHLKRAGTELPLLANTPVHHGDQIRIQGPRPDVEAAIPHLGYPERSTPQTDMVTVGLGIVVGAIIGLPALDIGGIPLSLTSSVGAMLIGLIIGQRRSKSPTFGRIPPGAQWFFESVGLAVFVGIVGINAGPGFIDGLTTYGAGLFFAGVFVTLAPLVISTYLAHYVFKFDPVQTLGMLTGAQTTTAAIGAVREAARSSVPLLGFTVPYAIGNIVLSIGGAIVIAVMS